MKIGDLFFGIKGEWEEFQKAAQAEGTKAGDAAGKGAAKGFSVGALAAKAFGVTAAAGFAAATVGGAQLQRVQSDYIAATGAGIDEAKAFAAQVNGMRGSNTQSLEAIAAAGTAVAQQFKVTGDEAKTLTQGFLDFGRVTKQDATAAVNGFDSVLDAFGLPASRAVQLMDQLVASNQKYGTDAGPAAQAALAAMAPALQAMGMGLDTGVGLLNLFEQAGIDAGSATAALNKAVKTLKPGQDLNDLITEIGAIEDPLKRADRAMEIFGAKGGTKFAQAIKPGMTSLQDLIPVITEVGGITTKTANSMDTDTDRMNKFLNGVKANFATFGKELGPAATGLASIASLGGPVVGSLAMMATGATTASAAFGILALSMAPILIALAAIAAAAWIFGESQKQSARATAELSKETGVAITNAQTYTDALRVQANQQRITAADGDIMRLAFGNIADEMRAAGKTAADARIELARLGWTPAQIAAFEAGPQALATGLGGLVSPLDNAALAAQSATASVSALTAGIGGLAAGPRLGAVLESFQATFDRKGEDLGVGLGAGLDRALSPAVEAAIAKAAAVGRNDAKWKAIGEGIPSGIGQGMAEKSQLVNTGMAVLLDIMKNGLKPSAQAAIVAGAKYIKNFQKGLHDSTPGAQQQAKEVGIHAIASLHAVGSKSRLAGHYYADLLGAGMSDHQIQVALKAAHVGQAAINRMRAEAAKANGPAAVGKLYDTLLGEGMTSAQAAAVLKAGGVSGAVIKKLQAAGAGAHAAGAAAMGQFASGMEALLWRVKAAAADAGAALHKAWNQKSPAEVGPLSKDGGTFGWGAKAVDLMAAGVRSRVANVRGAVADVAGAFAEPAFGLGMVDPAGLIRSMGGSLALSVAGGATVHHEHVHKLDAASAQHLREAGFDDREIGRGLADESELRAQRHASFLPVTADGW